MQSGVRSLGGKLIIVATSILLLCLLLFMILSWSILRLYSEYQARRDAQTHLTQIAHMYQSRTQALIQQLQQIAQDAQVRALLLLPPDQPEDDYLHDLLVALSTQEHIATLDVFSRDQTLIASGMAIPPAIRPADEQRLITQALRGKPVTTLQRRVLPSLPTKTQSPQWVQDIAVPIHDPATGKITGVLLASQALDNTFAQVLTEPTGQNAALCVSGQVVGTTLADLPPLLANHTISAQRLCTEGGSTFIQGTQQYLAQSSTGRLSQQFTGSPTLSIVAIEPLYNLSTHGTRNLLILAGLALFVFALGIIAFTFTTSVVVIRPLRNLQAYAQALVLHNTGTQPELTHDEELPMLTEALNTLSDSLNDESEALTEQMSHLLLMSDALMSTLNLEQLLSEFVARIGHIMGAKHVSLLLYGREMPTPWAVAQWLGTQQPKGSTAANPVTVHADPDGDITLAVTTKMTVLPAARPATNTPSGKRSALRPPKLSLPSTTNTQPGSSASLYGQRRPRIPRQALRDLDMILARMAIQRQKIVYGEDIELIYQERKEIWTSLALDAGYRSAIAVPLLLQDHAIGAFLVYSDQVYHISSRDSFLLSAAALQTAMAIQNALLFAEVKEKNAALERADRLKSQFLANVTHELRTPLHSIISYGALILEGFVEGSLTSEQEEHIQFMVRRAEDLSHLVDDMLDLSKIEADRIEIKPEPLKLDVCLQEVVNQLKPLANNKNLSLHLQIDANLPQALADGHRVRQVVLNLLSNALKFTEKGGVILRCQYLSERDMLYVTVTDTGIGISPAALDYIFEAFRQADGSTTRRFGGTGLGLTIARKLIELQGGEIAVESSPDKGTTFSFTLPVVAS